MVKAFRFIDEQLDKQRHNGLWRERKVLDGNRHSNQSARYIYHQQLRYINFCSNDYLDLAGNSDIKQAAVNALNQYGVGSTGSSLISGYSRAHQQLEQQLCQWLGFEACLLFNSGFGANSALLHALMDENHRYLVQDKLCHASLISAGMQVKAKMTRFIHNDVNSLQQRLSKCHGDTLVVTEGVFSMDGDSAPIEQIDDICQQHTAWLMIDDAHGIGVTGKQGQGSLGSIESKVKADVHMATFGKAIGTSGAVIGGSVELIEYLTQFCKHYIYSTAMPAAIAAATSKSIELIQGAQGDDKRAKLAALIAHFNRRKQSAGFAKNDKTTQISHCAIQPIIIGDANTTMQVSQSLKAQGIWVNGIRPPTVPPNTSRLRVTLNSAHEPEDIDRFFDLLESFL